MPVRDGSTNTRPLTTPEAVAVGVDALFIEVHEAPERALSDGANALRLEKLEGLMRKLQRISLAAR